MSRLLAEFNSTTLAFAKIMELIVNLLTNLQGALIRRSQLPDRSIECSRNIDR